MRFKTNAPLTVQALLLVALAGLANVRPVLAQEPQTPPPQIPAPATSAAAEEVMRPVNRVTSAIEETEKAVDAARDNDAVLRDQQNEIEIVQTHTQRVADALRPRLDEIRSQIDKLGPVPGKDQPAEAPAIATERARLGTVLAALDGAIKTTDVVQVRSRQLAAKVHEYRRTIFTRDLLRRTPSPLRPALWQEIVEELPNASTRVAAATGDWWSAATGRTIELMAMLAMAMLLFFGLRLPMGKFIGANLPVAPEQPPRFLVRAAAAGWVGPALALPALAALTLLFVGLDALDLIDLKLGGLSGAVLEAFIIFTAVSALAYAILQPRRPDWRLVDLANTTSRRLTFITSAMAVVYGADLILKQVIRDLHMSLPVSIAEAFIASLLFAALLLAIVRTRFTPQSQATAYAHPERLISRSYPRLLKFPLIAVAIAIVAASLLGYVALGRFIAGQVVITVSAIVLVLLLHLAIRSLSIDPSGGSGPFDTLLEKELALSSAQRGQLTSALTLLLNAGLAVFAIPLILLAWGFSPAETFGWLKKALFGFQLGQFHISLARILMAAALFVALLFLTRMVQRWLAGGALSPTRMDSGIAHSIVQGVGYLGFSLAALTALSYGGLDITNLAIVAGALSVGIGFGLQSIVNNFVSGIILLVERPIKVGDWVVVKGGEGFVKRIAVRATEIETFDRASLIVPNSELVANVVQNWTHRNPQGRIVIKCAASYKNDPDKVLAVLQSVADACTSVLKLPPPSISLDKLGDSGMEYSLLAVVGDITRAGPVKTELHTSIVKAFQAAGIELPNPQHEIHLKDLEWMKMALSRAIQDRARTSGGK